MADRRASAGFTLIEVMVALVVFSLAAMALIRLEGTTIRNAAIVDETLLAQLVAHNVAVDAVTAARPPTIGAVQGQEVNGGRAWGWARQVQPTGDRRILRIDVAVSDAAGRQRGRLTMVRADLPELPLGAGR